MKKRIITATILILLALPLLLLSSKYELMRRIMEVGLILGAFGAEYELLHMYSKEKPIHVGVKIVIYLFTILLYFSVVNWTYTSSGLDFGNTKPMIYIILDWMHISRFLNPFTVLLALFISLMAMMIFIPHFEVSDVGKLYVSVIYIGLCVGAFTVIFTLGMRFIVYLLLITVFTDIFALVFGMLLGKHKMAPIISPKKTWEGAIGGTCTALVVGVLFALLYPYISDLFGDKVDFFYGILEFSTAGNVIFIIILTLFLSVCSQVGDLVASKLKRAYGIKDYSNIFPGHGGILDRFDSALFASAIFLLLIIIAVMI
ncbi:MAG: phosphatidate cytidylyltransferase [Acholeplasmatales bacterium]|nr:phosphatidate cytidylyltransferase [Acholeplasmatales bacterium]